MVSEQNISAAEAMARRGVNKLPRWEPPQLEWRQWNRGNWNDGGYLGKLADTIGYKGIRGDTWGILGY